MEHDLFLKRYSIVLGGIGLLLAILLFFIVGIEKAPTVIVPAPVVEKKQAVIPSNGSVVTASVQVVKPDKAKATVTVVQK